MSLVAWRAPRHAQANRVEQVPIGTTIHPIRDDGATNAGPDQLGETLDDHRAGAIFFLIPSRKPRCLVDNVCDVCNDAQMAEHEKSGNGWSGHITGFVPVQGFGLVDGFTWYFRARGDHWEFAVADVPGHGPEFEDKAVCATIGGPGWQHQETWGKWPDAGYMPLDAAWQCVEKAIAKWRSERNDSRNT